MPNTSKVLETLQGRWQVVYSELDGQMTAPSDFATLVLEHKGREFRVEKNGKEAHRGEIKIDADCSPPKMRLHYSESPTYRGKERESVFQLEGDTLKTCTAAPGRKAPADFNTYPGSETVLTVHQRLLADGGVSITGRAVSATRNVSQW